MVELEEMNVCQYGDAKDVFGTSNINEFGDKMGSHCVRLKSYSPIDTNGKFY